MEDTELFLTKFINFIERDYHKTLEMMDRHAEEQKSSPAEIMYKFLLYAYSEFLEGRNAFKNKEGSWH